MQISDKITFNVHFSKVEDRLFLCVRKNVGSKCHRNSVLLPIHNMQRDIPKFDTYITVYMLPQTLDISKIYMHIGCKKNCQLPCDMIHYYKGI